MGINLKRIVEIIFSIIKLFLKVKSLVEMIKNTVEFILVSKKGFLIKIKDFFEFFFMAFKKLLTCTPRKCYFYLTTILSLNGTLCSVRESLKIKRQAEFTKKSPRSSPEGAAKSNLSSGLYTE
jgi:hypothetical protein